MSKKTIIYVFSGVAMTLGSMIPALWGGSLLGGWSIVLGLVGGLVGVWLGVKVGSAVG